ncbi:MAG: hypothetical protein RLZZ86_3394 [Cyanobacteriota bacterium]
MIKQIQWLENQVIPQQVTAPEQEVKQPPVQKSESQTIIQQVPVSTPLVKPPESVYSSHNVVESVGAFPNELYERLGLSIPRWLLWVLTFVLGITVSGLLASSLALWTPLWSNLDQTKDDEFGSYKQNQVKIPGGLWTQLSQYKLSRPMNILIMGIEPVAGTVDGSPENFAGKSDTMMLVRLNPSDKSIRLLSIPRGTMIAIPEQGLTQVSEANAKGGPVLAARVVSRSLNNAPIDRYIRISTSGFRQLVDQLGGVDVFVPQTMNYQDRSGGLSINLVSGWQNFNGEQAEQFARFSATTSTNHCFNAKAQQSHCFTQVAPINSHYAKVF